MSKLRDFIRKLRDLLTCFRKTVVVIGDVLDDIEKTVEMRHSDSLQTVVIDL